MDVLEGIPLHERGSMAYTLLIEFDDDNIVEKVVVVNEKTPCNEDETVCYPSDLFGEEIVRIKYAATQEIPEIYLPDFEPDLCKVAPELPPEQSMAVGTALFAEKRYKEAYICYLRVAESCAAWAQLQHKAYLKLSLMSELGWGTEPSLRKAWKWYGKASIR